MFVFTLLFQTPWKRFGTHTFLQSLLKGQFTLIPPPPKKKKQDIFCNFLLSHSDCFGFICSVDQEQRISLKTDVWIIHRPHRELFSLEILHAVPLKILHTVFCGSAGVTGTLFPERYVDGNVFKCLFFFYNMSSRNKLFHLLCIRVKSHG